MPTCGLDIFRQWLVSSQMEETWQQQEMRPALVQHGSGRNDYY